MGRIRATSIIHSIFVRVRRGRILATAFSFLALASCQGTILDGIDGEAGDEFEDGGATSGIGNFTAIEFEADLVGKFWPTTTIDEYLVTGIMPTLVAGYNPKMIFNLEKGLKKTLGATLMATALASIVAGDTSIGAIPVRVKYTAGHMKWTFTLADAIANSAWNTGILIDENGRASFITGKLQDTASILETQTGDIVIAGGKSSNLAVNWVGVLPSGTTTIASSEDGQATSPIRLKKKDLKPYLFYNYSSVVLSLVNVLYGAAPGTQMFPNLATAAATNTILIAHALPGASISPWTNWGVADLQYLTAYQPGDTSNDPANHILCDSAYNTSVTEYEAYSCLDIPDDDKEMLVDDGNAAAYSDLISLIWDPSRLFTPNYPIPANQTDTIKIEAM